MPGEAPLACAVRELLEETGYRAAEWARAGMMHNAIAYSDRRHRGLVRARPVPGERGSTTASSSRSCWRSADELLLAGRRGELTDAKTLIGLLWLQNWQAGRWSLDWRARGRAGGADNAAMKVLEPPAARNGHRFEGWFGSEDELVAQLERGLRRMPALRRQRSDASCRARRA